MSWRRGWGALGPCWLAACTKLETGGMGPWLGGEGGYGQAPWGCENTQEVVKRENLCSGLGSSRSAPRAGGPD